MAKNIVIETLNIVKTTMILLLEDNTNEEDVVQIISDEIKSNLNSLSSVDVNGKGFSILSIDVEID